MRRWKLLGLLTLALVAFATAAASSAMGAELLENLPEKANKATTGESLGKSTIYETLTGLKIECTKGTSTGSETASKPPSGTFHIIFTGCNTTLGVNVKCTGLADKNTGEILVLGTWKLVFDKNPLTSELVTAILFQPEPIHFVCAGFVLVVSEGEVLCLHTDATVKTKDHHFKCEQEKGDPKETHWWDTSGVEHTVELKQKIGTEPAEKAAEGAEGLILYTEEIFADV